uniref:Uncharacterized protein n=1 Tax=Parascaris equorum TaxID=6256 RepID=A0A914R9G3_PAREQ
MQKIGMFAYGVASASEVAFYSYIYAKLEKVHYKKKGKGLFSRGHSSVRPTNHQRSEFTEPETYGDYVRFRLRNMCSGLLHVYSIRSVAQYAQVLWGEADRHDGQSLNGFAEAAYTAICTFMVVSIATAAILLMNAVSINWDKWGEAALMLISALHSSILVLYSQTQSIYVMYACYVAYRSLYQVMITIAQWNLARKMIEESYGLVFGLNTFIALAMQTALTLTVSDKRGLGMNVRNQYLVYAGCHVVIGVIFTTSMCCTILTKQRRKAEIHVLSDNIHCKL